MAQVITLLMIGNSRLHWAELRAEKHEKIVKTWHTDHGELPTSRLESLYVASVVPTQTDLIRQAFPQAQVITLADIPLKNLYPTLGIDRALALYGAGEIYGYPCLVIDGGTALTFSGVNGDRQMIGGAILPGLGLQFRMLAQNTAALPEVHLPDSLPPRWAMATQGAIASGILRTILAGVIDFIQAWQRQFPTGAIVITGGDGKWLSQQLSQQHYPDIQYAPDLIFLALQKIIRSTVHQ